MKKKYLLWGAIATIVGVGYYYWNKGKEERQRRKKEADDTLNATPPTESGSQANTSNTGGNAGGSNTPPPASDNPFKTKDEVKLFQTYVEKVKRDTDILKPYGIDGEWGGATRKAWAKYGKDYQEFQKKQSGSSSNSSATSTQAKLNKDTMDKLYMTWGGNASAKKATHSKGRDLQVFFEVSGQVLMPYRWSIIFYEYAKGESRPTYTITDGEGKTYQRGNFSFNGSKYDFSATQLTGAGQRAVTSTSLITALNSLTKRNASLA